MSSTGTISILGRRSAWLTGCVLMTLGLLACNDDGEPADPGDGDAGPVEPVQVDELDWTECENRDEGFVLSHPAGWDTTGTAHSADATCGAFHPPGHPGGPVVELQVLDEPVRTLISQAEDDGGLVGTSILDRRGAAQIEPDDTDGVRWVIDLRNARTLELTGRTGPTVDAATLDAVVDRMTERLRWIDPRSSGEGLEPVGAPVDDVVEGRPDEPDARTKLLTDLRAAAQDGFDRVVVELDGDQEPHYRVAPLADVPMLDEAGIPVEGDEYLEITISPAALFDHDGERSYEGPARVPVAGGAVVEETVLVPSVVDDELRVVVGLRRAAGFAVAVIPDPVRLVVDVIRDPVVGEEPVAGEEPVVGEEP